MMAGIQPQRVTDDKVLQARALIGWNFLFKGMP